MSFKTLTFVFLALAAAATVFPQTGKTVTNADLEKYRQQRLKAEKDYQDNYARMGFVSPEEMQRQIEKSRVERETLAARLFSERLRQEEANAARADAEARNSRNVYIISNPTKGGYSYGYPIWYYSRGRVRLPWLYGQPLVVGTSGFTNTSVPYPQVRVPPKPFFMGRQR